MMPFLSARFCLLMVSGSLLLACGGSRSSTTDDAVALCKQGCAKSSALCFADAGATGTAGEAVCESSCATDAPGRASMCSNAAAIIAAAKICLARTTCADLQTCSLSLPACVGVAGGTGGSPGGTGGTLGAGGTGGSAGTAGAGAGTGGQSAGTGGSTGAGTGGAFFFDASIPSFDGGSGTCADLLNCCNAISSTSNKALCLAGYTQVNPNGDASCGAVYAGLKQSGACP
jgi:hypothetical protein